MVEYCAGIPADLKVRRLTKKYLLKRASRGILPDRNIEKRKIGFFAAQLTAGSGTRRTVQFRNTSSILGRAMPRSWNPRWSRPRPPPRRSTWPDRRPPVACNPHARSLALFVSPTRPPAGQRTPPGSSCDMTVAEVTSAAAVTNGQTGGDRPMRSGAGWQSTRTEAAIPGDMAPARPMRRAVLITVADHS